MRNYITLNGKNSNEINGLLIQELPPISKPQIRTEVEEIDGRDGDIVTKLGFAAYDKEFTVGLYKDFDINAIIAYFNSEGTVVFSNEPDKYYNYQIIDQIDFERLVRYRTATVRMHCQPFKYSNTEGARTLGNRGTASGEGSFITLDNTPEAQFSKIEPKGNAEQDGTPTPDSPVPVRVVTGENVVKIEGKNLFDLQASTRTDAGVVFTKTTDTITAVGTSTRATYAESLSIYDNFSGLGNYPAYATTTATNSFQLPAGTYAFSTNITNTGNTTGGLNIGVGTLGTRVSTSTKLEKTAGQSGTASATINVAEGQYVLLSVWYDGTANTPNVNLSINQVQLEKGSQASQFEPYQGQEFEVNLGKNLFDVSKVLTNGNNTLVNNGNGSLTVKGLAVQGSSPNTLADYCPTLKVGDVATLSATTTATANKFIYLYGANQSWAFGASKTITQAMLESRVAFYSSSSTGEDTISNIQLELGSSASSFAPYFTPIELAKIGNYQDRIYKEDSKWYIEKQVGKVVLDGSENWEGLEILTNTIGAYTRYNGILQGTPCLSNYFVKRRTYEEDVVGISCRPYAASLISLRFSPSTLSAQSIAGIKTWLSTHPTTVYYALAEPVDEEITNETLISQLEALYNQAHAYKGRTHVAAIAQSGNAPHIIEAEVQRSSDGNITNNGNIASKPTLTIYGSGNIGVSLNGYQILEITLGDEEYITIDTAAMEAYKDTLDNLKNRLVNGDYSKFALRPGSNMIEFSGTVSKCVISKYSRWL